MPMIAYDIPEGEGVPLLNLLARRHDGDWPVTEEWLLVGFPRRKTYTDPRGEDVMDVWVGAAKYCEFAYGGELLIDHGPPGTGYEPRTLRTRNEVRLFCAAFKIPMHPDMRPLWVPPEPKGG